MTKYFVIALYVCAVAAANLSATHFGIWATPINAFFLIGLEMTCRDYLHTQLSKFELILVVISAGVVSYFINQDSLNIALASSIAVVASCMIDFYVFQRVKGGWFKKSNMSNFFSATTDSILFPTIAFGSLNIWVTLVHIITKFSGGFLWGLMFKKYLKLK